MKKTSFLLIFSLICGMIYAQKRVTVSPYLPQETVYIPYSFRYMLPQTAFMVEVKLEKTQKFKGYYGDYAERLLGMKNIISNNSASYKIYSVSIQMVNIPDTSQQFLVMLSSKQTKKGFLKEVYQQQPKNTQLSDTYISKSAKIPNFFQNYADLAYTETDDSFVETKIVNGIVTQVPVNQTKIVNKTSLQQAQEAADLIAKIKKDRYALLSGEVEVPYSGEALQLMCNKLDEMELNYLKLFTGFTITEEEVYSFMIIPDGTENMTLFSIDPETGFSRNLSIKPNANYYLNVKPLCIQSTTLSKSLEKGEASDMSNEKRDLGYVIRKPQAAQVSLLNNQTIVQEFGIFHLYQLGKKQILYPNLKNFNIFDYVIVL